MIVNVQPALPRTLGHPLAPRSLTRCSTRSAADEDPGRGVANMAGVAARVPVFLCLGGSLRVAVAHGLHGGLRRELAGNGDPQVAEWESQIEVGSDGRIAESSWPLIERWARAGEPEAMALYGARLVQLGVAVQALPWF